MLVKSTIFWGVAPCSLVEIYRRFEETHCLHLPSRRVNQRTKRQTFWLLYCNKLRHNRFLPNPFQFIMHYSWSLCFASCCVFRICTNLWPSTQQWIRISIQLYVLRVSYCHYKPFSNLIFYSDEFIRSPDDDPQGSKHVVTIQTT
jgi:hypothetical protein